jgi:hypothetical protein
MSRHHHSAAFITACASWSRGRRKPWETPSVRRFSAGDAETDLVVVGTSLLIVEDPVQDPDPYSLAPERFEATRDVRGFVDWEHEPDEFDRQAEEVAGPDELPDDWQDHCGDPDCDICGEPPNFDGHL